MEYPAQQTDAELELQAVHKLFQLKWPNGFECPRCGYGRCYTIHTRRHPIFECVDCRHQTSLTVGTIMEGSRTPLTKWFIAIDLVARLEQGTTAVELSRTIQVTYKTAWLMLHKIRHALGQYEDGQQLTGTVRMNNGKYGRPHNPTVYRHPEEHPLIAAVSLSQHDEVLQLKIKTVDDQLCDGNFPLNRAREAFAQQYIDKHAELHGRKSSYAANKQPLIRNVCAQASRWLNATFHGLGGKHLNAYLDEYCCRLNLAAASQESLFERLAAICVRFSRISYAALVSKKSARVLPPDYYIARNRNRYTFFSFAQFEQNPYETANMLA
jgi:transposase-like protein